MQITVYSSLSAVPTDTAAHFEVSVQSLNHVKTEQSSLQELFKNWNFYWKRIFQNFCLNQPLRKPFGKGKEDKSKYMKFSCHCLFFFFLIKNFWSSLCWNRNWTFRVKLLWRLGSGSERHEIVIRHVLLIIPVFIYSCIVSTWAEKYLPVTAMMFLGE